MTFDVTLHDKSKDEIVKLISSNLSAISLIAEQLDISETLVTSIIEELVEEGTIHGWFSSDGLRFYRSDVKMPTALEEQVEEEIAGNPKHMIPKAIIATGISLFIAGQILIRLFVEGLPMHNTAAGMVMLGLITIFGGLFSLTKFD